jgi:hypothetical protein
MPTAPRTAGAFDASIVTYFAPEQDCAGLATSTIDAARPRLATGRGSAPLSRSRATIIA